MRIPSKRRHRSEEHGGQRLAHVPNKLVKWTFLADDGRFRWGACRSATRRPVIVETHGRNRRRVRVARAKQTAATATTSADGTGSAEGSARSTMPLPNAAPRAMPRLRTT